MHAAKKADLVMPIGEAHRDDLLRIGCRQERVRLLYMGVDAAFVPPAGQEDKPRRANAPLELIYHGTVNRLRGRDIMLEAIVLANKEYPIAHLTIVGASDEEIRYCNSYARRFGIADAVRVCGRVPGRDIPGILQKADAGLCFMEDLPWWRFNPPTKLFEYLVAGLPVLASDIRTHTQYVSDWYNGLICQYDSRSLADAIEQLWQRRAVLPALKSNARQSGSQHLWERIEPDFLQAIRMLAKASAPDEAQAKPTVKKATRVDKLSEEPR